MDGLEFNKIGFDQKRKYVVICKLNQTYKTGGQSFSDTTPNGECSLPYFLHTFCVPLEGVNPFNILQNKVRLQAKFISVQLYDS